MQKLSERLAFIISSVNIRKAELARIINTVPQTVSDAIAGRRGLPDRCLLSICDKWPEISYEWLKFGRGEAPKGLKPMESKKIIKHISSKSISTIEQRVDKIEMELKRLSRIEKMLESLVDTDKSKKLENVATRKNA